MCVSRPIVLFLNVVPLLWHFKRHGPRSRNAGQQKLPVGKTLRRRRCKLKLTASRKGHGYLDGAQYQSTRVCQPLTKCCFHRNYVNNPRLSSAQERFRFSDGASGQSAQLVRAESGCHPVVFFTGRRGDSWLVCLVCSGFSGWKSATRTMCPEESVQSQPQWIHVWERTKQTYLHATRVWPSGRLGLPDQWSSVSCTGGSLLRQKAGLKPEVLSELPDVLQTKIVFFRLGILVDGLVAGHLGAAVGLKTLSIHVCICPHFGM